MIKYSSPFSRIILIVIEMPLLAIPYYQHCTKVPLPLIPSLDTDRFAADTEDALPDTSSPNERGNITPPLLEAVMRCSSSGCDTLRGLACHSVYLFNLRSLLSHGYCSTCNRSSGKLSALRRVATDGTLCDELQRYGSGQGCCPFLSVSVHICPFIMV